MAISPATITTGIDHPAMRAADGAARLERREIRPAAAGERVDHAGDVAGADDRDHAVARASRRRSPDRHRAHR
jgi:hypothetical protein